ncbi:hypothetical protein ACROYT_G031101 [Oculina patagonica]
MNKIKYLSRYISYYYTDYITCSLSSEFIQSTSLSSLDHQIRLLSRFIAKRHFSIMRTLCVVVLAVLVVVVTSRAPRYPDIERGPMNPFDDRTVVTVGRTVDDSRPKNGLCAKVPGPTKKHENSL